MKNTIAIKNIKFFLDGYKEIMLSRYKKASGGIIVARDIQNLIGEPLDNIVLIELEKISPRKWQVLFITTEDDIFNMEDDDLYISSNNYNLKRITEQVEIYQYNSFFGFIKEVVCKKELEEYPDTFKAVNENDVEITQAELKKMYIEQLEMSQKRVSNDGIFNCV